MTGGLALGVQLIGSNAAVATIDHDSIESGPQIEPMQRIEPMATGTRGVEARA